jgi:hypothetical protein
LEIAMTTMDTMVTAARMMARDLEDEAAALAMAAGEVVAYLECGPDEEGDVLAALGTLAGAQAHLEAIQTAYTTTKALLVRARDGGR